MCKFRLVKKCIWICKKTSVTCFRILTLKTTGNHFVLIKIYYGVLHKQAEFEKLKDDYDNKIEDVKNL